MKFGTLMTELGAAGTWAVRAGGNPEIVGVCEDSRKVRAGDLFVARGGTKVSGAKLCGGCGGARGRGGGGGGRGD